MSRCSRVPENRRFRRLPHRIARLLRTLPYPSMAVPRGRSILATAVLGLGSGLMFMPNAPSSGAAGMPSTARDTRPSAAEVVLPVQGTGALFGYYQSGGAGVESMEARIGRKFDLLHRYHDFNAAGARWPTPAEDAEAVGGHTIHIGWELISYNGGHDPALQPAPALTTRDPHQGGTLRKIWTYRQVNNGSLDRYLDVMADRLNASPYDFIVDFNHEMDDTPDVGGSNTLRAAMGTRAEYKAAYRHIIDRFRLKSVDNVVWAWTVSGWTASDPSKAWSLQQLWPGSDYVDILMWDPYNHRRDRWATVSQTLSPFYNAIRGGLLDPVDPAAKRLPLGLGEYGCVADPRRPAWLRSLPSELKSFPGIVTVGYFSSGSWGALHDDDAAVAAFRDAGRDAYLRTR